MYFRVQLKMKKPTLCCHFTYGKLGKVNLLVKWGMVDFKGMILKWGGGWLIPCYGLCVTTWQILVKFEGSCRSLKNFAPLGME